MKKTYIFTFIMACVGAIIGAGFASGKEIVSFFGELGFWAVPFLILVCALFFWCFFLFSQIGKMTKPSSITNMTTSMFGKAHIFVDFCFIICTFITLASMLAGCDSIGKIAFGSGYNFCYLSILTAIVVTIIISVGLRYIYKINNIILPVILVFIGVILSVFLICQPKQVVSAEYINVNAFSGILSCVLYVSMNIFTNIFIIAKSSVILSKKQIWVASLITSVILCLFIAVILVCIVLGGDKIFLSDMPMLEIAYSISSVLGMMYSAIMWLAIFTTICIAAYSIQMWLNCYIKNKFLCAVIVLTLGFVFSRFGFSTIVSVFYPLEGIFGTVFIVYSSVYYFKNKNIHKTCELKKRQDMQSEFFATNVSDLPKSLETSTSGTSESNEPNIDAKNKQKTSKTATVKKSCKNRSGEVETSEQNSSECETLSKNELEIQTKNNGKTKAKTIKSSLQNSSDVGQSNVGAVDSLKVEKKNGAVVVTKKRKNKNK